MKYTILAVNITVLTVVSAPAFAQSASTVPGEYNWIAECAFLKLDTLSPGNVLFADLRSHRLARVTLKIPGAGKTTGNMRVNLSPAGERLTAVNMEGSIGADLTNKARELISECGAEAQAPYRVDERKLLKPLSR